MAKFVEPATKKFKLDKFGQNGYDSSQMTNPLKNAYSMDQLKGVHLNTASDFTAKKFQQNQVKFNNEGNINSSKTKLLKKSYSAFQKLKLERQSLPIYAVKIDLLNYLKKYDTNILVGDTGSGKTTQVPQFLYEEMMLTKGIVVVTQPRRIAAITVATRVAEEVGTDLGGIVGYSVRFDEMMSEKTKIKFATDGMVLRESMLDPLLKKYSWVILDEAHERTVNTDILFGVVKNAQKIRRDRGKNPLHILVMSATVDAEKFTKYFNSGPGLLAQGREHALEINFLAEEQNSNYVINCLSTVLNIHGKAPVDQGILVFLTGQEEIDNACLAMEKALKQASITGNYPPMKVLPLYASLPKHLQLEVFERTSFTERRVIFSTNIAETSVTIPGIRIVVDSGKAKVRTYTPSTGFDVLKVCHISQAQAWQRAGRAGREASGVCYHVYTEAKFLKMPMMPTPDIHRSNLATVVLQLLTIGVKDVMNFDFIDKPRDDYLQKAVEQLLLLEAVEKTQTGELDLTEDGRKMATFPLEPIYSKILLNGPKYNCTNEVLTIVSMLSGESVFTVPTGNKRLVALARWQKLGSVEGDHLTLLKVYQAFNHAKRNKQWCYENFLNFRNLTHCTEIRKQLYELCIKAGLKMMSCGDKTEDVHRCLLTGMFTQVAEFQPDNRYLTLSNRKEVNIHPNSVLFRSRSMYLMYTELIQTARAFMYQVSCVMPEWLYEVAPDYFRSRHIKADPATYAKE